MTVTNQTGLTLNLNELSDALRVARGLLSQSELYAKIPSNGEYALEPGLNDGPDSGYTYKTVARVFAREVDIAAELERVGWVPVSGPEGGEYVWIER